MKLYYPGNGRVELKCGDNVIASCSQAAADLLTVAVGLAISKGVSSMTPEGQPRNIAYACSALVAIIYIAGRNNMLAYVQGGPRVWATVQRRIFPDLAVQADNRNQPGM